MPYLIRKFEDAQLIESSMPPNEGPFVVEDDSINTATSLQFPGNGVDPYSAYVFESQTWLGEQFSGPFPPERPMVGQVWHNKAVGQVLPGVLYVYTANPADVELPTFPGWKGIITDAATALYDHIADENNPHVVTKTQLGLDMVDNTLTYIASVNLGDALNLSTCRFNLDVYSTSDMYSAAEMDARYIDISGGAASDSLALNNIPAADFVLSATPVVTAGIVGTGIPSNEIQFSANGNSQAIGVSSSDTFDINSGITAAGTIASDLKGGARIESNYFNTATPSWKLQLAYSDVVGAVSVESANIEVDATNLYITLASVTTKIHSETSPPTPAEVGALALTDPAVNTELLGGFDSSVTQVPSTVVVRDSVGEIEANLLFGQGLIEEATYGAGANFAFRIDQLVDNDIKFSSASNVAWSIGATAATSPQAAKAYGNYTNGVFSSSSQITGLTEVAAGYIRIHFDTPRPNTNYCVNLGNVEVRDLFVNQQGVPPARWQTGAGLVEMYKGQVYLRATTHFDLVFLKARDGTRSMSTWTADNWATSWDRQLANPGNFSFSVYQN